MTDRPSADLPPGTRLGDYTLVRRLGRGASASVYAARHAELGVERALKVLAKGSPQQHARFEREGQALARVQHPGVVRIHAVGSDGPHSYLVLDLVEGRDLASALDQRGAFPLAEALDLVAQVAAALSHVHALGLVHRDLKPANVLLRADGQALLTDFGIARDAAQERLTATGALIGTPRHMAPEQLVPGLGPVSDKTDVFALGTLLYELCSGEPAFSGRSVAQVLAQIAHGRAPAPSEALPSLPRELDRLVVRCLQRDPAARPSAAEVAAACQALRQGDPNPLAPVSGWRQLLRRAARRETGPVLALGGVVGTLLLCASLFLTDRLLLAPRREAQGVWRAYRRWQAETLGPHALSLAAGDPARLERQALLERQRALEQASPLLSHDRRSAATAAQRELEAHLRLLDALAGQRAQPLGRANESQPGVRLVDALILATREPGEAYARLAGPGAGSTAERLLALRLAIDLGDPDVPARVLGAAQGSRAHALARAQAPPALRARAEALTRAALDDPAASPPALSAALAETIRAAAHLELPAADLRRARAQQLAAQGPAWERALLTACAAGEEQLMLAKLAAVVDAGDPVEAPAPLQTALARLLDHLAGRFDTSRTRQGEAASLEAARRLFAAHDQILIGIDPSCSGERFRAVALVLQRGSDDLPVEILLGCLRAGAYRGIDALAERADPDELADYLTRRPLSRAARLVLAAQDLQRGLPTPAARAAMVERLETIRTTGPADLAPDYQGLLDVLAARLQLTACREAGACTPTQAAQIRERTRRAREHLDQLDRIYETFEQDAQLAVWLEDTDALEAAWAEGVRWFREHPGELYSEFFLGRVLSKQGLAWAHRGQLERAEAACREGLQRVRHGQRSHGHERAALARVLRLQGRLEEAGEVIWPHLEENAHDADFMSEAVALCLALGDTQRAREIYQQALRALGKRNRAPTPELLELGDAALNAR